MPVWIILVYRSLAREKIMNRPSVFKMNLKTGLLFMAALFFVHGSAQASSAQPAQKTPSEPCQLTPVEKYLERHPESQWPPSRREEIRRCDNVPDQGGSAVKPSAQGQKSQKK